MTVDRIRIGGTRELRITRARGLLFIALHDGDRCASGPLGVPFDAVETLRSALGDVLGEHGSTEATDPERAATRTPGSGRAAS